MPNNMSSPVINRTSLTKSSSLGKLIAALVYVVFVGVPRTLFKNSPSQSLNFGARSLAYLTSRSHTHLDFFMLQRSISCARIFKPGFSVMKKCSCRDLNPRLLIGSTNSYPIDQQDNDAEKCNFLLIIF